MTLPNFWAAVQWNHQQLSSYVVRRLAKNVTKQTDRHTHGNGHIEIMMTAALRAAATKNQILIWANFLPN